VDVLCVQQVRELGSGSVSGFRVNQELAHAAAAYESSGPAANRLGNTKRKSVRASET
jgi:hypothetical protein